MKRVLITGGGTGIGADLARGFAEAGAEVVIAGRRAEALEAHAGGAIRAIPADVSDETSVRDLFAQAGPCDVVIANAGIADSAPLSRVTLAQWTEIMAVNLTGTFLTLREGLRQMQAGPGRLIAIASVAGLRGVAYASAYAASKHGVVGLVRSIALELGETGITANAICPGYTDTAMTARTLDNITARTGRDRSAALQALTKASPQNRLIEPSEITATALFLCSEQARGINGQSIAISGGTCDRFFFA